MLRSLKLYAAIGAVLAMAYLGWWLYNHGKLVCAAEHMQAALDAKAREDALIVQLQEKEKAREVVVREKIITVRANADACYRTALPPAIAEQLRLRLQSDDR